MNSDLGVKIMAARSIIKILIRFRLDADLSTGCWPINVNFAEICFLFQVASRCTIILFQTGSSLYGSIGHKVMTHNDVIGHLKVCIIQLPFSSHHFACNDASFKGKKKVSMYAHFSVNATLFLF